MKLLSKINRSFLLASLAVFIASSLLAYFLLKKLMYSQQDDNLKDEKEQVTNFIQQMHKLPVQQAFGEDLLNIRKAAQLEKTTDELYDSLIYNFVDNDYTVYRLISFTCVYQNENYIITVGESRLESDDFTIIVLLFLLIFILAFFSVLFLITRTVSKKIWLPFNDTLVKLKSFDIAAHNKINFEKSGITEFEELNDSLNKMTAKIYSDYDSLKQFSENASHEISTPLSVIRSKTEILLQSENFSEIQMQQLQRINEAISRLSKLNTALLTLTKIENRQFAETEKIELAPFIQKKLSVLLDLTEEKNITVSADIPENIFIEMNPLLSDILFENLINNAIKHNMVNGFINIKVLPNKFSISNPGAVLQYETEKLFHRFIKNNPSSDSLGLGLAMVKQICSIYNFTIVYSYNANIHSIVLSL